MLLRRRTGRRRAVVHVGAHKTGTTVIQQYLASHPNTLRRHGIRHVPRPDLTPLVGWGEKLVSDPAGFEALLGDFAAGREHTLLLSHENLCGPPMIRGREQLYPNAAPQLDALGRAVSAAGLDTTVLLTLRPQHEFVESYYLQQVNLGMVTGFRDWLARVDLTALSWTPLIEHVRTVFGEAATVVVDFGRIRDGSVRYVEHVLRSCGIGLPMDEAWEQAFNPSVSDRGLRILVRGNAVLADRDDRIRLRSFVQREFSNRTGPRPTLLTAAERDALRERYAAEYRSLVAAAGA